MCTEKDPIDCHRAIMVGRAFSLDGIEVKHILSDGELQTQEELDKRLVKKYFPEEDQLTLFDYDHPLDMDEKIKIAYKKRNSEIGCRVNNRAGIVL